MLSRLAWTSLLAGDITVDGITLDSGPVGRTWKPPTVTSLDSEDTQTLLTTIHLTLASDGWPHPQIIDRATYSCWIKFSC